MKRLLLVAMGLLVAAVCPGATHYVVTNNPVNPSGIDPYTNWETAGTNIIDVVNAAMTNTEPRLVVVSNGIYYLTNHVYISKAVTIQSISGRDLTTVDGGYGIPSAHSGYGGCFYLNAAGVALDGFTVTNGAGIYGGGIYSVAGATVQNCRVTGCISTNSADTESDGGGVYTKGTMLNCEISGNICYNNMAGGIYMGSGSLVSNCIIANNSVTNGWTSSSAREVHGAGIMAWGGTVVNCRVYSNSTFGAGAASGAMRISNDAVVRNSLFYDNYCQNAVKGAVYVYNSGGTIQNCTIASNRCAGIATMVATNRTLFIENTISYLNAGGASSNIYFYASAPYTGAVHIINSCIAPTSGWPTAAIQDYYYAGNIESDPQFADKDSNNFRLAQDSPCVNAGTNQDWMTNAVDLDGAARIRYGRVDMGAYERIYHGVVYGVR